MKRFRSGTGRLDARTLNDLMRSNDAVQRAGVPPFAWRGRWYGPILCQVNAATSLSGLGKRWRYEVVEVGLTGADGFNFPADGFASDYVYNVAEFANTATTSSGITRDLLPGSFEVVAVPTDAIVEVYVGSVDGSTTPIAWFNRPNEFWGACDSSGLEDPDPFPVQWLSGHWTSSTQFSATELVGTQHVIDFAIGGDRWSANSVRFWNGSEAINAGAVLTSGRNTFATTAECRAWWDNYTVRVNVNDEGWQYLNATNDETTTVGGSAQRAYLNASPAISWTGSDFAANVTMEVQVFTLPDGGPAIT